MKYLLAAFAALCMALPVAAQSAARWGPADVWVTTQMGDTLQVMQQRYPPSQLKQDDGAQTLTTSWKCNGKTITVSTTRFRFNDHGAIETVTSWENRHDKAIIEMQKVFPPDPPSAIAGGDGIGSLPGPEHTGPCPPGGSVTAEWSTEILCQPGAVMSMRHHAHQAVIYPEPYPEFVARFAEAQASFDVKWPAVP